MLRFNAAGRRLEQGQRTLVLQWSPREQNVEADELSNALFHRFDPANRVHVPDLDEAFPIMRSLIKYGEKLYESTAERKASRKLDAHRGPQGAPGGPPLRCGKRRRTLREEDPW